MKTAVYFALPFLCLGLFVGGCKDSKASAGQITSATVQASAAPSVPIVAATQPATQTHRIVFVDKEHACQCTQKRVDDSWAALQAALAGKQPPTIERFHVDSQPEQVESYVKMRAMVAVPALYFIDAKGGLVELLQGEVTQAQVEAVLGTKTAGH